MQIGAVFPTCEIGVDPVAIRDWAQAAESLGYGHMVAYDHVLGGEHANRDPELTGPYTEKHPFHEPFVLFGFLAGLTQRIQFSTGVLILSQRQTALVAKQAAQVDLLSGGRLRLGVGTGWNYIEYEALGMPWKTRGKYLDEQVGLLRQFWAQEMVEFNGGYHRIDRAGIAPRPSGDIPIWFGGGPVRPMKRAAQMGDGFIFTGAGSGAHRLADDLRGMLVDEGRDPNDFGIEFSVAYGLGPEKWASIAQRARESKISHLCVSTMSANAQWAGTPVSGLTTVDEHIAGLEQFIEVVRD